MISFRSPVTWTLKAFSHLVKHGLNCPWNFENKMRWCILKGNLNMTRAVPSRRTWDNIFMILLKQPEVTNLQNKLMKISYYDPVGGSLMIIYFKFNLNSKRGSRQGHCKGVREGESTYCYRDCHSTGRQGKGLGSLTSRIALVSLAQWKKGEGQQPHQP